MQAAQLSTLSVWQNYVLIYSSWSLAWYDFIKKVFVVICHTIFGVEMSDGKALHQHGKYQKNPLYQISSQLLSGISSSLCSHLFFFMSPPLRSLSLSASRSLQQTCLVTSDEQSTGDESCHFKAQCLEEQINQRVNKLQKQTHVTKRRV